MHPMKGKKQLREHVEKRIAAGAGRPDNTPEVLWSKVDKRGDDECWPWMGYRNAQGYGRTWIKDKGYYAHRVIFDLANPGVISRSAPKRPQDIGWLMHSCDNPACCNPRHLMPSTHAENMADKKAKGRSKLWRSSTESPRATFSAEDVRSIRQLSGYGLSSGEIAKAFNVTKAPIKALLVGRTYRDV